LCGKVIAVRAEETYYRLPPTMARLSRALMRV